MSHKILKSFFPTEEHVHAFQRLINNHIWEMEAHDKHMAMVKKDPKTYQPYPAPVAHPDVLNCIVNKNGKYNIDFEIVDDSTVGTLEERKNRLSTQLHQSVQSAVEKIIPARKRPLVNIEVHDILVVPEEERTKAQKKRLTAVQSQDEAINKLLRHHAQIESDIHDLTDKTIDGWKFPPLPEVK